MPRGKRGPVPEEKEMARSTPLVADESDNADRPEPSERLSFKLDSDGKLDFSSLRTSTAEKAKASVKASMEDPAFRAWLGLSEASKPQIVSPQFVGGALDAVALVEASMLSKKYGLSTEVTGRVCAWSEKEHAALDTQGAALLNKYIPASWLRYADVAMFCSTLLMCIKMKMSILETLSKAELEKIGAATHPAIVSQASPVTTVESPSVPS